MDGRDRRMLSAPAVGGIWRARFNPKQYNKPPKRGCSLNPPLSGLFGTRAMVFRSTLAIFGRVYVINLPTRSDRREQVTQELRSIGVDFRAGHVELLEPVRTEHADGFLSCA